MKPLYVSGARFSTTVDSVLVLWSSPVSGEMPEKYVVKLLDSEGSNVKGSRKVVQVDSDLSVTYSGLEENGFYKVGLRAVKGRGRDNRGPWLFYDINLEDGSDIPLMPNDHYMYQVNGGEKAPENAIGEPTRHVRLVDGVWTRVDLKLEYIANKLSPWYNRLEEARDALESAEDELEGVEPTPVEAIQFDRLEEEVEALQLKVNEMYKVYKEEADKEYPPENLTENDTRWYERPNRPTGQRNQSREDLRVSQKEQAKTRDNPVVEALKDVPSNVNKTVVSHPTHGSDVISKITMGLGRHFFYVHAYGKEWHVGFHLGMSENHSGKKISSTKLVAMIEEMKTLATS